MFRLSQRDFRTLLADADVVEADGPQLKVLRFSDGDFLKLFRRKRWLSSATFYPYSRRFCRNTKLLAACGVPTVAIQTLFSIPSLNCTAVRYSPLPGITLRDMESEVNEQLAADYGRFLAKLHAAGVYFRAVHPGNTVIMPDGQFGLIDVGQIRFFGRPLSSRQRAKNLQHIARSELDADFLARFENAILEGYESAAKERPIASFNIAVTLPIASPQIKPQRRAA